MGSTQISIQKSDNLGLDVDLSLPIRNNSPPNLFAVIPRRHKRQKPITRGVYECSRLSRVFQLPMTDPSIRDIPRAGVVFYTFIDDKLHMCFGRHKESKELTDFGGIRLSFENSLQCAVREGNEEARLAFSKLTVDQIMGFYCLYSSLMLIVFIPVASPNEMDIRELTAENFQNKQFLTRHQSKTRCYNELSEIVWLDESEIENLFSKRPQVQMFRKVRRFIYSCNEFSQDIDQMKIILKSVIIGNSEPYTGEELIQTMTDCVHDSSIDQKSNSPPVQRYHWGISTTEDDSPIRHRHYYRRHKFNFCKSYYYKPNYFKSVSLPG